MKTLKNSLISWLVLVGITLVYRGSVQAQSCTTTTYSYSETFNSNTFFDPNSSAITGWPSATGLKLNLKAGAFSPPNPNNWAFGSRVYATLGGDFTGDGTQDILAVILNNTTNACSIEFYAPNGATVAPTDKGSVFTCPSGALTGTVMAAGDINNDGKLDFVYAYVTNPAQAGTIAGATLFVNTGVVGGLPTFATTDLTSMLQAAGVAWHVGGNELALADWDGDKRADLFALSSSGSASSVLMWPAKAGSTPGFSTAAQSLISPTPMYTPIASSGVSATGGYGCEPGVSVSKGGSMLAVADFNGDGLKDIYLASVQETALYYYTQNTDGTLTQNQNFLFGPGGPLYGFPVDVDKNGTQDLVLIRSGNDCNGNPPEAWILYFDWTGFNHGTALPLTGGTIQYATMVDLDNNGSPEILAGKLTGTGTAVVWNNQNSTSAYALSGTAQSKPVATLNGNVTGVVSLTVTNFAASLPTGTAITVSVSNNGGQTWDALNANELTGTQHNFSYFGSDLRWKAYFTATSTNFTTAPNTYYVPASATTPTLTAFAFNYLTVPQGTYTRSGLAEGQFVANSNNKTVLYSAAFQYPGFQGYLYAYDISNVAAGGASSGALQQVSGNANIGTSTLWEAGSILQGTTGSTRTLYTAYPVKYVPGPGFSDLIVDGLLPFNATQMTSPSSNPNLMQMMGLNASNGVSTLNFIINGLGNATGWKFFDPGHSSPVFVGSPNGDQNYLGHGYSTFATGSAATRQPIVLVGGNDGMLHAFNAATGVEMWGFIPNNLLSNLANQVGVDPNTGGFFYNHQEYVDGTIQVGDVYSGSAWHTVAVVGEGQGTGTSGNHYYFAVDITNTASPVPLWEFSDTANNTPRTCSGNSCTYGCSQVCYNTTYVYGNTVNDSYFNVPVLGAGVSEAETYDSALQATSSTDNWVTSTATPPGTNAGAHAYVVPTGGSSTCATGSTAQANLCTQLTYRFSIPSTGTYYPWFRNYTTAASTNNLAWGVDGTYAQTINPTMMTNTWTWVAGTGVPLAQGDHVLNVWMNEVNLDMDQVAVSFTNLVAPSLGLAAATPSPGIEFQFTCTAPVCATTCLSDPNNQEWPQCGVGSGQKCCQYSTNQFYCSNANAACGSPPTSMGQTWSKPAVGPLNTTAGVKYAAFFGSGYNDRTLYNVGRSLYAVDAFTGYPMGQWNLPDVTYNAANPNIDNTTPGGVALADVDNDGYVDRVYIGDLTGRLWKLNTATQVSLNGNQALSNPNIYATCVVFDAGNPNNSGTARGWAPIITRPAVAVLNPNTANVYFGTGGDDRAPNTNLYRFYSVRDNDAIGACASTPRLLSNFSIANGEWVVGDGLTNTNPQAVLSDPNAEGTVSDRYWADPVISNNDAIYFASLPGSIESVNPCLDLQGSSKIFGYAIQNFADASGTSHIAGQTIFPGNLAWIAAQGKVRQAALLRNQTLSSYTHGVSTQVNASKSDVFIQQFSNAAGGAPTVSRITEQGSVVKSPLRVLRWREISL